MGHGFARMATDKRCVHKKIISMNTVPAPLERVKR